MEQTLLEILKFKGVQNFDTKTSSPDSELSGLCFVEITDQNCETLLKKSVQKVATDQKTEIWIALPSHLLHTRICKDLILENRFCTFGFLPGQKQLILACLSSHASEIQMAWNYFNLLDTKAF